MPRSVEAAYRRCVLPLYLLCLLLSGCKNTTVVDTHRAAPMSLEAGDAIVVLGRRHTGNHETEYDFIECVGSALQDNDSLRVIPEQEFVDAMYPYFEASTAPMDVSNLDNLIREPAVLQRFSDFHIRYFVWIDGFTERTASSGSMTCAVGPGGGGCFGFTTWDDEAKYEASLWDFRNRELSGKISAETQGTSLMPAIIIPIPLLARVQANACRNMADQIRGFLQPEQPG